MMTLADWRLTWTQLGLACPDAVFAELRGRYEESHRAYHTLQHLRECFDHFQTARHLTERPAEIELALWFHDAIYDPRRSDNEERSRDLAVDILSRSGVVADVINRVEDLILATRHAAVPADPDARLLVDVDLAILAAGPERFAEYEWQIRHEYSWVPWEDYRAERSRILTQFLNRASIFSTDWFQQRFEQPARLNLERSLRNLFVNQRP